MSQTVEHLPSKHKAVSVNPNTAKNILITNSKCSGDKVEHKTHKALKYDPKFHHPRALTTYILLFSSPSFF
jgi:hypothetical protein